MLNYLKELVKMLENVIRKENRVQEKENISKNYNEKSEVFTEDIERWTKIADIVQNDRDVPVYIQPNLEMIKNGKVEFYSLSEEERGNKEIAKEAVKINGMNLSYVSDELKNDKEIVLLAIENSPLAYKSASDELKNDREVVVFAIQRDGKVLEELPEEFKNDKEIVLMALEYDKANIKYIGEELKDDSELADIIIKEEPYLLEIFDRDIQKEKINENSGLLDYASYELKNDPNFIIELIKDDNISIEKALENFGDNEKVAFIAVEKEGVDAFKYISSEIKEDKYFWIDVADKIDISVIKDAMKYGELPVNDYDIVIEMVQKEGSLLQYASEELKGNKEIVIEAVQNNSDAFKYATPEIHNDKEVIEIAIDNDASLLEYISDELKNDKKFITETLDYNGRALEFVSEEMQNDKEIVMIAVSHNGYALRYSSDEMKADKEIVTEAVSSSGKALDYASYELKNDPEVVSLAIEQDGEAIKYVSDELKNNKPFMTSLLIKTPSSLRYILNQKIDNTELAKAVLEENPYAIKYIPEELPNYKELALVAVKKSGYALTDVAPEYALKDKDLLVEALKQTDGGILEFIIFDSDLQVEVDKVIEEKYKRIEEIELSEKNESIENENNSEISVSEDRSKGPIVEVHHKIEEGKEGLIWYGEEKIATLDLGEGITGEVYIEKLTIIDKVTGMPLNNEKLRAGEIVGLTNDEELYTKIENNEIDFAADNNAYMQLLYKDEDIFAENIVVEGSTVGDVIKNAKQYITENRGEIDNAIKENKEYKISEQLEKIIEIIECRPQAEIKATLETYETDFIREVENKIENGYSTNFKNEDGTVNRDMLADIIEGYDREETINFVKEFLTNNPEKISEFEEISLQNYNDSERSFSDEEKK